METLHFKQACDILLLNRNRAVDWMMWLKNHKHLVLDIGVLSDLVYPEITWRKLYEDFVLWELGYDTKK